MHTWAADPPFADYTTELRRPQIAQHSITRCSSLSVGSLVHWMSHHDAKEGVGFGLIPRLAMRHTLAANGQCTKAYKESSTASPQHGQLHIPHKCRFQSACIVGSVAEHALQKKHLTWLGPAKPKFSSRN